jgi:cyclopropane-fatty-acyl-phospholipid synthase
MRFLPHLLKRFIRNGRLTVIDHDGMRQSFGSGADGPDVTIRFTDAKVEREIFFNPELRAAEAYMDQRLEFENGGTVHDLLVLFSVNRTGLGSHPLQKVLRKVWMALRGRHQSNPVSKVADNASRHYDLTEAFYSLWLDESMTYTCAYFETPETPLAEAQRAKLRHVAAKLDLKPGMRVLEIGSGWGGLAIYLAKTCGVQVTGLNVSPVQLAESRRRAAAAGVGDMTEFVEQDYRVMEGQFDRIVSIGMMEAVGIDYFDAYFGAIKRLLKPGGYGLVHCIGRMAPPGTTAPFIRKYIFPGGYVPSMSEVFASTERVGLWVSDCEFLRMHYYWTIRHWRQNFAAVRPKVVEMMGERFARMWEFYLSAVELGFLTGSNMVFHVLLSSGRMDVPVTRDYMFEAERALKARGG